MSVGRAALLGVAGVVAVILGMPQGTLAQGVQACTSNCAQVTVNGGSGAAGGMVTAQLSFAQAQSGSAGAIAALALTLSMTPDGVSTPLTLADCTLNGNGLPAAVIPDPAISGFTVVVENASCANGRTHCLCPDPSQPSQTQDNFINIVVYGPNPLPTPGPNPIVIPVLPSGPLLTVDLSIAATATGTIPLHLYNQVQDTSHPQFTALLSVGDKTAVDQTCVPVSGSPPCSSASAQSQIAFTNGSVSVNAAGFLVCDVVPFTGDDAGQFGDGTIKNNDVVAIFNASLQTGVVPASGSARFDAMDSVSPADSPPACGGDGTLKNNDVVTCFNRSLGEGTNYDRTISGSTCTSALAQ